MAEFEMVKYEKIGKVARIMLNRPERYNALNRRAKGELIAALKDAGADESIGCAVLTGAGDKAFCAGQDLHETQSLDSADAEGWVRSFEDMYVTIRAFEKPLVAAVNGVSTGSGFQLPLLCDVRLAASHARFAMTEIDVGFACIIGTTLMWDTLGRSKTTEMILSGSFLSAQEAKHHGLVAEVYDSSVFEREYMAYAAKLAEKPPVAAKMNKAWFGHLTEENFNACIEFAVKAHQEGYKAGEPNRYQKQFFQVREERKGGK